jgi:hypothetical protein
MLFRITSSTFFFFFFVFFVKLCNRELVMFFSRNFDSADACP